MTIVEEGSNVGGRLPLGASIAGAMATMVGAAFGLAFLLAPRQGLVAAARRRTHQKWEFAQTMLAIHLFNHEGLPEAAEESRVDHLGRHLRWNSGFAGCPAAWWSWPNATA
jgi:manganese/zinc/iron transport system permease protein